MQKQVHTVVAGIDIHRKTAVVAVRTHRDGANDELEVRTFETFRDSLVAMAQWLEDKGVEVVGMESTGVYWIPVLRAIQETTPKRLVWLINPLVVKHRAPRGRKTDRKDSVLISELVMYGQVRPSYVPSWEQNELRKLTRHRSTLVADQTRYKNRIIKELECSGVKLSSVVTDCLGVSGRAMIDAILKGDKTPAQVAQLARGTLRKKIAVIARAVEGAFTPSTAIVLRQLLKTFDAIAQQIGDLEREIEKLMVPHAEDLALLKTIPGMDDVSAAAALAESGADMSLFPGADNLTSWAGLSPGSDESAGKAKKAPTRKGNKFLRTTLVQCSWAAVRTKTCHWKATFHKLTPRLGPKKGIVAIARKMLTAYYYMLRDRRPFSPPEKLPLPSKVRSRMIRSLTDKLKSLGVDVTVGPTVAVS
jgi:transposase